MRNVNQVLFRDDRRAAAAVFVAVALPFLIISTVLGLELGNWWYDYAQYQRAGDTASAAGALTYKTTLNAQTAATRAAYVAELNGVTGSASPTWNAATNTLTDGNITVIVTLGSTTASGASVQVQIAQSVQPVVSNFVNSHAVTISTSSTSKIAPPTTTTPTTTTGGGGGQPCILALNGDDTGVTTGTDITFTGHVTIDTPGCTIRSNAGIVFSGGVTVTAAAYYAGGTITTNGGSGTISGTQNPTSGQVGDPFAVTSSSSTFNKTLQNALTAANAATGVTDLSCNNSGCTGPAGKVSCTKSGCTASPGTYANWKSTNGATLTLSPGLYVFTGSINLSGGNISGSAVTILMAAGPTSSQNTATTVGSTVLGLTAPTTTNVFNGALAGIMFASLTTGTVSFGGNTSMPFSGALYLPNGNLKFAGTPVDGATGCAMVIAETITISGNVNLASSCGGYGLPTFDSLPVKPAALVLTLVK